MEEADRGRGDRTVMQIVQQLGTGLAALCDGYEGGWTREGNLAVCLTGEFPADHYAPVLMWTADSGGWLERERFWPVYEKSEDLELRYRAWSMKPSREGAVTGPMTLFESNRGEDGRSVVCEGALDLQERMTPLQQEAVRTPGNPMRSSGEDSRESGMKEGTESCRHWIILEVKSCCGQNRGTEDLPRETESETASRKESGWASEGRKDGFASSYLRVGPIYLYWGPEMKPQEEKKAGDMSVCSIIQMASIRDGKRNDNVPDKVLDVRMERVRTDGRGEIVTFLRAGNGRPPLRIIFAGTKPSSLEPALRTMQGLETPCLVLADPRLGGEGFFLGTEAYENAVVKLIGRTMEELNISARAGCADDRENSDGCRNFNVHGTAGHSLFTCAQTVFSGVSFGAGAAIYYGAMFSPRAILLAEPILSAGNMALEEKFGRNGSCPLSLDLFLLMKHDFGLKTGSEKEAAQQMDQHMWDRIKDGDFSRTEIALACMEEDEYDSRAFDELKDLFANGKLPIWIYREDRSERAAGNGRPPLRFCGRVRPGRHIAEDSRGISSLTGWLEQRYKAIADDMENSSMNRIDA